MVPDPSQKPYIRVVMNEVQVPLIIRAVRLSEIELRMTAHRVESGELKPEDVGCATVEHAVSSLRAQARQLSRWHKFVVREAKERGWYASGEVVVVQQADGKDPGPGDHEEGAGGSS